MKTFQEWLDLRESVTFFVQDYESEHFKDILELCSALTREVAQQSMENWRRIGVIEPITPDASDHFKDKGTINFYVGQLDEPTAQKMLNLLVQKAKEHKVVVGQPRLEKSNSLNSMVWRIPVQLPNNNNIEPPELNLSNTNAHELLRTLEIEPDYAGTISARDLLMKVGQLSGFSKDMMTLAPSQDGNMYSGGRSADQVNRYLDTLENMAKWAIQNHYDQISWG